MIQQLQVGSSSQSYPSSWDLVGIQLTVGEIASAEAVRKHSGSIFSFSQSARLFDAVENALKIRIQNLPPWLKAIDLARTVAIYGAEMRRIKIPQIMQDLDMQKLSGLATFVVLCCRYTESEDAMIAMLKALLEGHLGCLVKADGNQQKALPYSFHGHLGSFVRSCVDADKDSNVSRRAQEWMASLHDFGACSYDRSTFFSRNQQESVDLISELFGAVGREEDLAQAAEKLSFGPQQDKDADGWGKTHDTLHLTAAYIAFTAAAHGARVYVQVVSDQGSKTLPTEPMDEEHRKSSFLVRLWLKQPPEHVRGILRHRDRSASSGGGDDDPPDDNIIVGGGTLEIATWIANMIGFNCTLHGKTTSESLLNLWQAGTEYGKTLQWLVRREETAAGFAKIKLVLKPMDSTVLIPPVTRPLSAYLAQMDRKFKPIARAVSNIAHDLYGYSDYSKCLDIDDDGGKPEIGLAMEFTIYAIAIQVLRNTVSPAGDSADIYALNLSTLRREESETRNLINFVRQALNEGTDHWVILTTAATVWGGMKYPKRTRNDMVTSKPSTQIIGVIAPQCTVIFDFLRDPLSFAASSSIRTLISIWRGPVPMLPRDPVTSFIYSGHNALWELREVKPNHTSVSGPLDTEEKNPVLVTFEPFDQEATSGVFCFWHRGQLLNESSPHSLLVAILTTSQEMDVGPKKQHDIVADHARRIRIIELGITDLLKLRGFNIESYIGVVIKPMHDISWLLYALACAAAPSDSINRLQISAYRGRPEEFDIEAHRSTMVSGQIIILIPQY
ncbi:unnamed protein product [Fusarium graminearum]|uniref:Chromosome 2, complete genome n=1 Tax=Gibberella zeae (strain ATCC MYA-4620 / CBS 123657 / FGSC 9075 / NRRL 31084 / PH-1) TaxID=229533 RepID=A0A098DDN9_GIBZE|nr:unnamed protein product [Fusarium graminearum]CAF3491265.1 unnamed protein product [Fusarium graminearum]CEF76555.1 unnamed protein product [Fusarium graminearum]CZS79848.1 unnamed protein product [Fusarium graminearum]